MNTRLLNTSKSARTQTLSTSEHEGRESDNTVTSKAYQERNVKVLRVDRPWLERRLAADQVNRNATLSKQPAKFCLHIRTGLGMKPQRGTSK